MYPSAAHLPLVLYALVSADAGEGVVQNHAKSALRKRRGVSGAAVALNYRRPFATVFQHASAR